MKIIIILFFVLLNLINAQENNKIIAFAQDTMANDFRKAQVFEAKEHSEPLGKILATKKELYITTKDGQLKIDSLQFPGKKNITI